MLSNQARPQTLDDLDDKFRRPLGEVYKERHDYNLKDVSLSPPSCNSLTS